MRLWKLAILAALVRSLAQCSTASGKAGDDMSDDQRILNKLEFETKYSKLARPPPDYNATNIVHINFVVVKILEIDEVGQSMSVHGYTEMAWKDRRLAWADKFNGTSKNASSIFLPRSAIWIPDVITWNTMERNEYKFLLLPISVMADGLVFSSIPFGSKTLCDINMQYFPFDSQTCTIIFGSWQMTKEYIELRVLSNNISTMVTEDNRFINFESDEYCITKREFAVTPKETVGMYQEAVFTLSFQRKPLFYVMNLVLPSFLILVICVCSFFLPPESGERLSLNITLMLALTVFLQIVAEYTPAQSDNVPILTTFFSAVVALSAVSTIGSMFNKYCYFKGQSCQTVDSAAVRLVFLWRLRGGSVSRAASRNRKESAKLETESPEEKLRAREDDNDPRLWDTEPSGESEWHTVGRRLDNGLFLTMVISTLALGLFIGCVRNPNYVAC